jgi:hypothetical protein
MSTLRDFLILCAIVLGAGLAYGVVADYPDDPEQVVVHG